MSTTVELTRATLGIRHPATLGDAQKRSKTRRSSPGPGQYGGHDTSDIGGDTARSNKSVPPIDKSKLKLSVLKQYNELVADDEGLTCRSLPPVKVSVKLSKTKFVDTPRADPPSSSRILKPLLTMKTHTAGHHVFTEGISKTSKLPKPTFALPEMRVPYSNLPENVMIYKEKNKFAFGVKHDNPEPSPYRLTPRPADLPAGLKLHIALPDESTMTGHVSDGRQVLSDRDRPKNRHAVQLKSNKIVLEPILSPSGNGGLKSGTNSSESLRPVKPPLVPCNSVIGHVSLQKTLVNGGQSDRGDRRVSVVSIGDNVTQNIYETQKRNTRKLYPMYDNKSRQDEIIKRARFGGNYDYVPTKLESREPTYIYKVSSRNIDLGNSEPMGHVSPIKNNIKNRPPPLVNAPRGLGSYRRYAAKDPSEYDSELSYHEQKFRRLYRRAYYPPNSPGSNNSTEMSFIPGNPPPSVTSQLFSEADVPQNYAEFKKEMKTLIEEKEKTASVFSVKMTDKNNSASTKDEDKTFVNVDDILEDAAPETGRTDGYDTQTDTDIQMDTMNSRLVDERKYVNDIAVLEEVENTTTAAAGAKGDKSAIRVPSNEPSNTTVKQKADTAKKQNKVTKPINNAPKQLLGVPTFSLDKLSHHPFGENVRERTSLSRTIQYMTVADQRPTKPDVYTDKYNDANNVDKAGGAKDNKVVNLSVTKLRLFSESSAASFEPPRVSLTDEYGDELELSDCDDDDTTKPDNAAAEKRLVVNANIQFISPLINDNNAKRQ